MSALVALQSAAHWGVSLKLNDDKISFKARVRPPPELLDALREHKAEIIALLRQVACADPDEAEIVERKAMAMGGVPEAYLDGWARLQCQRPATVSDDEWRQAIVDAGLFLDQWGGMAVELGWTPADLFDPPSEGNPGGLVWRIRGQGIRALGDGHAVTIEGARYDWQ